MRIGLNNIFFISHIDADGYASMVNMFDAIIGIDYLGNHYIENDKRMAIEFLDDPDLFLNLNYPMEFPFDKVPENRIVFITDYSFTEDTIDILYKIAEKSRLVVWTDHHKTSMWYKYHTFKEEDEKIVDILVDGISSSMTSWYMNRFFSIYIDRLILDNRDNNKPILDIDITEEKIREIFNLFRNSLDTYTVEETAKRAVDRYTDSFNKSKYNKVFYQYTYDDIEPPMYIKLIDDYDIWKHEYVDTLPFHYGLEMFNNSIYTDLMRDYHNNRDDNYLNILDAGDIIKRYIDLQNEEISTKYSFVRRFFYDEEHGMVDILCVNCRGNSFVFGDKFEDYPFCLLYHFDGDVWKYSIYCHKKYLEQGYDASVIAKDFGGGGHAGASGFSTVKLLDKLI